MTNEEIVKNAPDWATHWVTHNNDQFNPEYGGSSDGVEFHDCVNRKFNIDKWTFTPLDELKTTESVYTQEMKDNGEPVKVGMKFKCSDGTVETIELMTSEQVAYISDTEIIKVNMRDVHPIKSEREEAEEVLIKKVVDVMSQPLTSDVETAKKLLEAGLLAEIILPLKRS